jgi:hypothetical protein
MYAALERNTGKVGLASVLCNETAVNPEIAAIQAHQDPASTGAAATNKAIVLALAQQLQSIGADPQEALQSGTFAPGDVRSDSLTIFSQTNIPSSTTTPVQVTPVTPPTMSKVAFSARTSSSKTLPPLKSAPQ